MKYLPVEATSTQFENLKKLATYLEESGEFIRFDMRQYLGNDIPEKEFEGRYIYSLFDLTIDPHPCGSVGCAVGHGPAAGITPNKGEYWGDYAMRVFGASNHSAEANTFAIRIWGWCFHDQWYKGDNSALGAAKRIRFMLEHGVPKEYTAMRRGAQALPYEV